MKRVVPACTVVVICMMIVGLLAACSGGDAGGGSDTEEIEMYGTWHWTGQYVFSMDFNENGITFAAGSQVGTIVYEDVNLDNQELVGRITAHADTTQIGNYHKISWMTPVVDPEIMADTDSTVIIIYKEADSIANAWSTELIEEMSQQGFYTRAENPPPNDFVVLNIVMDNVPFGDGEHEVVFVRTFGISDPSQIGGSVSVEGGSAREIIPFHGRDDLIDGESDPYTIWFDTDGDEVLDAGEYVSDIDVDWYDVYSGINLIFSSWAPYSSP